MHGGYPHTLFIQISEDTFTNDSSISIVVVLAKMTSPFKRITMLCLTHTKQGGSSCMKWFPEPVKRTNGAKLPISAPDPLRKQVIFTVKKKPCKL